MIWQLHGALGSAADWEVVGLENAKPVDLYENVLPYGEWARCFCDYVRDQDSEPLIMGYSMGGRLALHALLEAPNLWQGAYICSTHTGLSDDLERATRWERDLAWQYKVLDTDWGEFMSAWNAQRVFGEDGDGSGAHRIDPGERRSAMAEAFDCWSLGRQADLLPRLAELDLPVCWIVGERDEKYVDLGRRAVKQLTQGDLEIVSGAGHRVPWEAPEAVKAFVSANSS